MAEIYDFDKEKRLRRPGSIWPGEEPPQAEPIIFDWDRPGRLRSIGRKFTGFFRQLPETEINFDSGDPDLDAFLSESLKEKLE